MSLRYEEFEGFCNAFRKCLCQQTAWKKSKFCSPWLDIPCILRLLFWLFVPYSILGTKGEQVSAEEILRRWNDRKLRPFYPQKHLWTISGIRQPLGQCNTVAHHTGQREVHPRHRLVCSICGKIENLQWQMPMWGKKKSHSFWFRLDCFEKEQWASRMARQTLVRSYEPAKIQLHQPCSAHSSAEISEGLSWCITTLWALQHTLAIVPLGLLKLIWDCCTGPSSMAHRGSAVFTSRWPENPFK